MGRAKARKKTGPKRKFDLDKLYSVFETNIESVFRADGKVVGPTHSIWTTIKRVNKIPSSEKAIYNDAIKWNKERNEESKDSSREISGENDLSYEEELNSSLNELSLNDSEYTDDGVKGDYDITFFITLQNDVWKTIKPISKNYERAADESHQQGERSYDVLVPGVWTSLLTDKIAEHPKKIICNWSFKHAKVTASGKHYISLLAKCVTCKSTLVGFLQNKPNENENVTFNFGVKNFDDDKHKNAPKKVRVTCST